jgi:hypothetical protein
MTITELIATLYETKDPDTEARFDRFDDDIRVLPYRDGDTWTMRGYEYVGEPPCFGDGVVVLHP